MADAAERFLGQMVDQYAVLELQPGADHATVRAAYRRLAREFHPDVNRAPEAAERMRSLNAAYEALTGSATAPNCLAPARAAQPAVRTAAAPRGGDFWYRWAASSAQGGAVAVGSHGYQHAITAGVVAGFFLLVALLAGWAFAVSRPNVSATAAVSAPRVQSASSSVQSTTSLVAAQASANAAANAAAARNNVGSSGVAAAPTAAASAPTAVPAGAPVSVAGVTLESRTSAAVSQPAAPAEEPAPVVQPEVPSTAVAQPTQRQVMPSVPVVPAVQANANQNIQAVSPQQSADPASATAAATRALSGYDKAWTSYAGALRFATAGSMLPTAGQARTGAGASAFMSSDAQLTMARAGYIQQQLAFNGQTAAALAAAPASAARPDAALAARAELRLRQAAELVSQAQATGTPAPAAQVKTLLDEAEQAHREWVAQWAKLLASAS